MVQSSKIRQFRLKAFTFPNLFFITIDLKIFLKTVQYINLKDPILPSHFIVNIYHQ